MDTTAEQAAIRNSDIILGVIAASKPLSDELRVLLHLAAQHEATCAAPRGSVTTTILGAVTGHLETLDQIKDERGEAHNLGTVLTACLHASKRVREVVSGDHDPDGDVPTTWCEPDSRDARQLHTERIVIADRLSRLVMLERVSVSLGRSDEAEEIMKLRWLYGGAVLAGGHLRNRNCDGTVRQLAQQTMEHIRHARKKREMS